MRSAAIEREVEMLQGEVVELLGTIRDSLQRIASALESKQEAARVKRERAKSAVKWRRRPEGERLTDERIQMGIDTGLSIAEVSRAWNQMGDWEYRIPKSDVDAAWRNWCRKTVADRPQQRSLLGSNMTAAEKTAANVREFLAEGTDDE